MRARNHDAVTQDFDDERNWHKFAARFSQFKVRFVGLFLGDSRAFLHDIERPLTAAASGLSPKSKSSRRTLDLPQELARELKIWKLKCPPSEDDLVFATIEGKPLHRKLAMQILDRAITAAEVKRLTLHKLRHTFASLLISRNVPITKVSRLLGHRDSVITLKVYAHFIEDKKNDVQDLASSILS